MFSEGSASTVGIQRMTCEMVNFDTLVGGARSDGSDGSDAYQGQPQWTKINLLDRREVIKAMAEVVSAGPTRPAEMMVDHMRDELAMHQVHISSLISSSLIPHGDEYE